MFLGALLLVGCQGQPVEPPVTPPAVVDTQPPTIVRRTQNNSQDGNRISDNIEIFFSESLKADSVSKQTVIVSGKNAELLSTDVSYDEGQKKIIITPRFNAPNAAKVTLADGIKDLAGNAFISTNFTLNYPEWTYLDTTSLERPDNLTQGALAFDSENKTLVAYFTQFPRKLIVKTYSGNQWSDLGSPLLLDSEFKYQISSLKIIVNNGVVYAGWKQSNNLDGQNTFVLKKFVNLQWIEVTRLVFDRSGLELNYAMNSRGVVYIAFYDYDRLIRVQKFDSGSWQFLSSTAINQDMPYVSPGTPPTFIVRDLTLTLLNDLPVVAWSNAYPELIQVKRWDGSSWVLTGNSPSIGTGGSVFPFLTSKSNRLIVSWIERDPVTSQSNIYAKEWLNSNWVLLGGKINETLSGGDPMVFFAPGDDQPQIIYWEAGAGKFNILIKRYTNQWDKLFLGSPYGDPTSFGNLIRNQPFFDNVGKRVVFGMDFSRIYIASPNIRD